MPLLFSVSTEYVLMVLPSILQRIPRKFVCHFKEKLLGTVRLIGPSSHAWNVEIAKRNGDVFFQIGWKKFAQDHSLAERDFLVFQHIGSSSFNVSIFDETGCEREGAFFVKKHVSCTRNACFLQNEDEKITDVEEMKGRMAKREKPKGRDDAERQNQKAKLGS